MEISKWMWIPADEEVDIMWCMPPEEGTGEKLVWMQGKILIRHFAEFLKV